MCSIDGERADVWYQTEHRARIQHKCQSCALPIEPGHVYLRTFCVYDGDVSTKKVCAVCAQIWIEFQTHHGFAFEPDTIDEQLAECVDFSGAWGAGYWASAAERIECNEISEDDRMWRRLLAVIKGRQRAAKRRAADLIDGVTT